MNKYDVKMFNVGGKIMPCFKNYTGLPDADILTGETGYITLADLGKAFSDMLTANKISKVDAAYYLGLHPATLSIYTSGKKPVPEKHWRSIEYLVAHPEDMPKRKKKESGRMSLWTRLTFDRDGNIVSDDRKRTRNAEAGETVEYCVPNYTKLETDYTYNGIAYITMTKLADHTLLRIRQTGLSTAEIAEAIGVRVSTLHGWWSRRFAIPPNKLKAIEKLIDLTAPGRCYTRRLRIKRRKTFYESKEESTSGK